MSDHFDLLDEAVDVTDNFEDGAPADDGFQVEHPPEGTERRFGMRILPNVSTTVVAYSNALFEQRVNLYSPSGKHLSTWIGSGERTKIGEETRRWQHDKLVMGFSHRASAGRPWEANAGPRIYDVGGRRPYRPGDIRTVFFNTDDGGDEPAGRRDYNDLVVVFQWMNPV